MHTIERIKLTAKANPQRIVLPESQDPRTLEAAAKVLKDESAQLTLLGDPSTVQGLAKECGANIDGIEIIDPSKSEYLEEYIDKFVELRKHKGMTPEKAREVILDPLFFGAMMIRKGHRDGMVAGAVNTTANVLRATILIVGLAEGVKTVSSCFLMILPEEMAQFGADGNLIYTDSGVVPNPTAEQLADIAMAGANSCRQLVGAEPNVAFLSFSTKGSADHEDVDKVRQAVEILKSRKPDFAFDGELQGDAALVASIGERKCPDSPVAGKANVLVFPDLDAGNISYKLTERLARAEAYGPIIQGGALPVNDLSRGCCAQDIANMVAITAAQAIGAKSSK